MSILLWIILVALGSALAYAFLVWLPRRRLDKALQAPFPSDWMLYLQRSPVYKVLPSSLQLELQQKIKHFLHTKRFVGCDGLQVSDEMRVTIAAEACLLILNRPSTQFRKLRWIYIFPSQFRSKQAQRNEYGVVSKPAGSLLGVSWSNGRIVLAWDSVQRGVSSADDGSNVVLHEFAHQLDQEDGSADGAPLLYDRASYKQWSEVLGREFNALREALERGEQTLINPYGATNPAEFFAVITELFFERPAQFHDTHPELFNTLLAYYRIDPQNWQPSESSIST
ncbi:M90 family metallopeptidase [Sediminihaliea albiluteola]|uniref:M90 family metallopeptidase n=1 Tax=Sediminihaliea albiluteola TaxID=2758564 RepID=UPI001C713170|nr:M90 family metallopeptidase [Sediminihaliea albiluteola]